MAILILLKSLPNKFAHQAGYYLLNGRWHTMKGKPAPKGAPVAAHPHAAGEHAPAKHLSDDEWNQLKLPDSNVNAGTFNKQLDQLKQHSEAGHVTGILGSGYGTNTYGKKLATIANHLLEKHGSQHKVTPGQKAGEHQAVQSAPADAESKGPVKQADLSNIEPMDSWEQTGPQKGSNPGGKFKDENGVEWYCKFPSDADTAKAEVLAAKLYALAGVAGQDAKLITKDGKLGIASKWIDVKKASASELAKTQGVAAGFAVDAWLANWDVVGLAYDNLQVGADGKAVRIDAGGSLMYRAQGGKKDFGNTVAEIDSLRDSKTNAQSASVFAHLTDADITASAAKVVNLSNDDIYDLVMEHGPGDLKAKTALVETLIARKDDLAAKYPKAVKKEKAEKTKKQVKPDPTKLKVTPEQLVPMHDFANWNGNGQGLSSKAHVNEANQKAEKDLLDFALKGNLVALKDYHFEALDKDTGASLGMKPIHQHPSQYVKTYWSDLVATLGYIANPPEALKKFTTVVSSSISKISDAFKSHKYGQTTAKADANSRLAFWIALGATKPAEALLPDFATTNFELEPKTSVKITTQMRQAAKDSYAKLTSSRLVKRFINGIQSSGTYNDNFRDGLMTTEDGKDAAGMVLDAYDYATEKPEGFEIYKWLQLPANMVTQLKNTPPGTVFQNPGSMCCSFEPTSTSHFGKHRMRIRYAKGAKAVDSYGSGNYSSEYEITTLPGQRFVIISSNEVNCPLKGKRLELDVLMLPPDESYVAELETMKK